MTTAFRFTSLIFLITHSFLTKEITSDEFEIGRLFDSQTIKSGHDLPELTNHAIKEASGLDQSQSGKDVFWINNDSGDSNRIFAINKNGKNLGQLTLTGAKALDYEDIATGPGPKSNKNYIYIGDIGDNNLKREIKTIYRVEEPHIASNKKPVKLKSEKVSVFPFKYPRKKFHNAEALLVDPFSLDFFIITKSKEEALIYRGNTKKSNALQILKLVGKIKLLQGEMLSPAGILAGDISSDGLEIMIRTHRRAFYWKRNKGENLEQILCKKKPEVYLGQWREPVGESICIATDGSGYYTISEESKGYPARLRFYKRL